MALPTAAAAFHAAMAGFGPFETPPHLAVAVSGGPDSLALLMLADIWAAERGGRVTALTVDHGLRADSAAEAARVGRTLADRGIDHEILTWRHTADGDGAAGQAAARAARYRLLHQACRRRGILHLLVGHSADDQAETVLMRLAKGSGPDGLAGMAAADEQGPVRLLRPLLGVPKAALVETCRAAGLDWLEDPSNASPGFARGRLRRVLPALAPEGLTVERLAALAERAAPARRRAEALTADALAEAAAVYPEGYATLDLVAWQERPDDIRERVLGRLIRAIGAADYSPRQAPLSRLCERLAAAGQASVSATLGGCRLAARGGRLVVAREAAAVRERRAVQPGETVLWDRRLTVTLPADLAVPTDLTLARLGRAAHLALPAAAGPVVPAMARAALPGLWSADGALVAAPPVPCARPDRQPQPPLARLAIVFTPPAAIAGAGFVAGPAVV